ncbi:glycerophosphodiester phosphodiesterase family protein [Streptomyces sp. NBC_01017]|uniref:glycerophosphodiester phosphodiesterase n=1 Tax=Streptomyces sp. NBC_01017 TaxID=2903721 RepID=UPI00386E7E53|nr:glycerophosphodiester phosphodiesterase family protein [Streptomyces sp. NBC_01017]
MALYTYGGTADTVLTTSTGDVVPDYPVDVRVAGTGQSVTALYESDGTTPISELRSNPAGSEAPGAIRTFMCEWPQIEYVYNATGGRTVTWYQAGREVPIEALQTATSAASTAAAADEAATAAQSAASNAAATAESASSVADAAQDAAQQAAQDASDAIAAVSSRLPTAATVDTLPSIVYDAHRGGAGEAPENTLAALRGAMPWADVLDLDSQVIGDGTPVLMHDSTVDRTTKAAGNVSLYNAAQWGLIRSDPSAWFAASTPDLPLHTVEQILDDLGGRRVMTVEAKNAAGVTALANMIKARRLERSVLINTNDPTVIPTIKTAGCLAHLWRSASQMATDNAATIKGSGADLLDLDIAGTDAQITAAIAQNYPLGVWAHTLVRRKERDRALSLGCKGIITDYPGYVSGRVARRTASSFSSGQWGYGYVSSGAARPVLDASGRIPLSPPASSAAADAVVMLAGEVSPAPATTTIDVKFSFPVAGSTGWSLFSVHLGADDDATVLSGTSILHNGYTCQISNDRSLRIYRDDKAAGTSTQLANTATSTALSANTVYTLRVVITATQITLSVPEVAGLTTTVTDSTYRVPWYLFVGRNYTSTQTGLIYVQSITTT